MSRRRRQGAASREFPRTARVNELVREIVADELERIDDPRLEWVSITSVSIVAELTQGLVYYSSLEEADADPEILAALDEHRIRLQRAIAGQARLRRTPELRFAPDSGVRDGLRVESILSRLEINPDVRVPDSEPEPAESEPGESASAESEPGESAPGGDAPGVIDGDADGR